MFVVNTSDVPITDTFSIVPPLIGGGVEAHIPPRGFTFAPGVREEIPDEAGEHFLKKYGPVGLMRYKIDDDLAELTARGRRIWYRTLERQCAEIHHHNGGRLAQGLPPLVPSEHTIVLLETRDRLAAELSQVVRPAPVPPPGTETPEFKRAAAARREQAAESTIARAT